MRTVESLRNNYLYHKQRTVLLSPLLQTPVTDGEIILLLIQEHKEQWTFVVPYSKGKRNVYTSRASNQQVRRRE